LLGGGLDRGSSTLLVGPAGCGKTTLCSHFLLAALQRGETVACYQFEESKETFIRRSRGFGMEFAPYLTAGKFAPIQVHIADLSPGEFAVRVQRAVEQQAMNSPIDVSFLADTVILLRFFEAAGRVRQAASVVKKRQGFHERTLRELRLGPHGMEIGDVLEEFQGVLTGVPRYRGKSEHLLDDQKKP
jgi:circadian clock protein KaiC